MWGEDGIIVSVIVATVVMFVAVVAGFTAFDSATMWVAVAAAIAAWLAAINTLAKRYARGRWPFRKADPWEGQ